MSAEQQNNPIWWRIKDKILRFEGQNCPCCKTKTFGEKAVCPSCNHELGKVLIGIGEICSISAEHTFSQNGSGRSVEVGVKFDEREIAIKYNGKENNFAVGMKVGIFVHRPKVNEFEQKLSITPISPTSSKG